MAERKISYAEARRSEVEIVDVSGGSKGEGKGLVARRDVAVAVVAAVAEEVVVAVVEEENESLPEWPRELRSRNRDAIVVCWLMCVCVSR